MMPSSKAHLEKKEKEKEDKKMKDSIQKEVVEIIAHEKAEDIKIAKILK